ncbi:MAG: 23S rRNA (uracil(1939)-C(5))-methyltransferase RlmD [Burkholderiaceae bacterium]|nr:23S rRNA (uracil(1939)-C(5))-methyltransferase RlmD [Burkholderiaceae bacterium]
MACAIESIDLDANGISRHDGKVVFVRGGLPGERVLARVIRRKPRFDVAETIEVVHGSSQRVVPPCPHFGVCGGCSMQHLAAGAQLAIKQRALEDQLWHIGRLRPETMLRAIAGPALGYRYRARLSVRNVPKKGGVLVGFRERASSYVADIRQCEVLAPRVSALLLPLRALVESLSVRDRIPQIEVAVGTREAGATDVEGRSELVALVFRVLEPPSDTDLARLAAFSAAESVEVWLQPKGPDSISLLAADGALAGEGARSGLGYDLPEFGLRMPYRPTDFTQVNHAINTVLVGRAIRLLGPQAGERVADLFCGLGNFSLPLAARGADVTGIEGSETLCTRAAENARANGLAERTRFEADDLFKMTPDKWRELGHFDRVLIDPPREGAQAVCQALCEALERPKRMVYVSCNPATLARDAAILVHTGGYRLRAAGAINMFPQTSHVESIAVFE